MKKIINGFLKKEVQRFGLSMAGLILCLIAVSVIPEVRPLLPVFAVVFSAIIILALSVSVVRFLQIKADIHSLSDNETIMFNILQNTQSIKSHMEKFTCSMILL